MSVPPSEILVSLYSLGFAVSVEGEDLVLDGPPGILSERRRHLIKANKEGVIALLTSCSGSIAASAVDEVGDAFGAVISDSNDFLRHALLIFEACEVVRTIRTDTPTNRLSASPTPSKKGKPTLCDRCQHGKPTLHVIHNGKSLRRDCGQCVKFIDFPVWQDEAAVGQYVDRQERS